MIANERCSSSARHCQQRGQRLEIQVSEIHADRLIVRDTVPAQPLRRNCIVVKRDDSIRENLEGMAALAGDEHGVAATSVCERRFNRGAAVRLDENPARASWNPASRSLRIWPGSSVRGLLSVRITRSALISATAASSRRIGTVTTAVTAQDTVNAAGGDGSEGGQGFTERGGGPGAVDPHLEVLTLENSLEMSGNRLDRLETGDDRRPVDAEAPRQGSRGQCAASPPATPTKGRCTATSRSNP